MVELHEVVTNAPIGKRHHEEACLGLVSEESIRKLWMHAM